ncbi:hypothetical protein IMG5_000940 [Ichthyophthirius multifiliis]|uniref:Cytochrome b5 heme-binding domain-containing protein n=1 Tax=Ichthyophthirius multifiliis TaxID=5932 RepID=G0QIY1_ICHMU|nr:hypothetical protein IMG5_000940 [Ichthyophthirius multifiliis]EGR34866.1 hypothetical protein IMG5_000940 [Ichthyophthirius multifiliis]|eukprot:XP_004040170.1 hypothetical protein IMG5_000940 [Ichthyophthirius multifiliis]
MIVKLNIENENGSENVHKIKFIHKINGYLVYIVTKINLIIGADMYEKKYIIYENNIMGQKYWWAKAIGGLYIFQIFIRIIFEIVYQIEPDILKRKKSEYKEIEKSKEQDELMERLNNNVPIHEINKEFPNLLYLILGKSVYDVTEIQHPGGQFILKHLKGKEISRYFYGGYQCEQTKMQPYRHSLYANNFIQNFYIGDIKIDFNPFIQIENVSQLENSLPKECWILEESREITQQYKVLLFHNRHYKIKNYIPGVRWFGKSATIQPYIDSFKISPRNYSIVIAYTDDNIAYRIELMRYFQYKMMEISNISQLSVNGVQNVPQLSNEYSTLIPFLIKKYTKNTLNGLSKFLHIGCHKLYNIDGPIGQGLQINEFSDGDHIIFVAGTGVLPFIDLLDYLLKKVIYTVIKANFGQQEANLINPYGEKYEQTLQNNFRIKFYGCFESKSMFYGYQIVSDLYMYFTLV